MVRLPPAWNLSRVRLSAKANALAVGMAAVGVAVVGVVVLDRVVLDHGSGVSGPTCGVARNTRLAYDVRPLECLWQAYSVGRAASGQTINSTVEGDQITFTVSVVSAQRLKARIDSNDRYGPRGQFNYVCQAMIRVPSPGFPRTSYALTGCTGDPRWLDTGQLTIP